MLASLCGLYVKGLNLLFLGFIPRWLEERHVALELLSAGESGRSRHLQAPQSRRFMLHIHRRKWFSA